MNFQDWLILIGAVILIAIILDGVRRMRQAKRDSLQMSRDMGGTIDSSPLDEDYNPELPAGGARIIGRRSEEHDHDVSMGFGDGLSALDLNDDLTPRVKSRTAVKPELIERDESEPDEAEEPTKVVSHGQAESTAVVADALVAPTRERVVDSSIKKGRFEKKTEQQKEKTVAQPTEDNVTRITRAPSEVLVINVDAKTTKGFAGTDLKRLLEACGLVHGEMSIFHRHEEDDLLSPLQFSVANGVEPGYFDPDSIETINTPRVAFFMSLPGPRDSMRAFDFMLETAQCFARNLDGELRDEHRSAITQQTIEHCRQRIREFERKQLSRSRKV